MSSTELLPWDSRFFGITIGRWSGPIETEQECEQLRDWVARNRVECTYCLVDASDAGSARRLEELGARLVDVRLTYTLELASMRRGSGARPGIRLAGPDDFVALSELAAEAHADTRFFFDPRFDRERVRELYREWLRSSLDGTRADGVVTFDHGGGAAGYVSFSDPSRTRSPGVGEIGIVAVARAARGTGGGTALLAEALEALRERGTDTVRVVTQARNVAAQRLYQRAGFTTATAAAWFHLWSTPR